MIVIDTGVAAEVGSLAALATATADAVNVIKTVAGLILRSVISLLTIFALLWSQIVKPLLQAIQKVLQTIQHVLDKILKPYLDWMRQMRQIILDLYNRFIRPIIVLIESLRRIIHLFQLLHIHIFDRLDQSLAYIEGKLLKPIIDLLRRTNTLGNWVSFIINVRGYLTRGLLLGSMQQQRGGAFNLLASTPAYGFVELPPAAPGQAPVVPTFSYASATAAVSAAAPDIQVRFAATPASELVACWEAPLGNIDLSSAINDMVHCITS